MIEFDLSEASPARNSKYSYGTGKFSQASMRYAGSANHSALRTKSQEKRAREATGPGNLGASSSVNLEKAYEELEKEIMEIKSKLQKSITNDDESSNNLGNSHANSQYKYRDQQ